MVERSNIYCWECSLPNHGTQLSRLEDTRVTALIDSDETPAEWVCCDYNLISPDPRWRSPRSQFGGQLMSITQRSPSHGGHKSRAGGSSQLLLLSCCQFQYCEVSKQIWTYWMFIYQDKMFKTKFYYLIQNIVFTSWGTNLNYIFHTI